MGGGGGRGRARPPGARAPPVVLRTGLDVSLLNKTVNVPLAVSLNEVRAPQSAERTALTARLDGVDGGQPFSVLRADVASAKATVSASGAEASTNLTHARIHVPGLPLLSLIEVGQVTSKATCEAGRKPAASATLLGGVTVLGKKVTLTVGGPTEVKVPGVGEVRIDFSKTRTTSRTAAASALELHVSVNPLKLNVADVEGTLTLGSVTCESPSAAPASAPASVSAPDIKPQGAPAKSGLAETGGTSTTPFVVGAAVVLLAAGGAAVWQARRRRNA
ncbi:SCO1860 family LAETG-anchored protein [Streptomyces sp. NPDC127044]